MATILNFIYELFWCMIYSYWTAPQIIFCTLLANSCWVAEQYTETDFHTQHTLSVLSVLRVLLHTYEVRQSDRKLQLWSKSTMRPSMFSYNFFQMSRYWVVIAKVCFSSSIEVLSNFSQCCRYIASEHGSLIGVSPSDRFHSAHMVGA